MMLDTWGGDHPKPWRRARVPKHAGRRRPAKGKHRGGCLLVLVPLAWLAEDEPTWKKIGCGTSLLVWAAVLVPLILWC